MGSLFKSIVDAPLRILLGIVIITALFMLALFDPQSQSLKLTIDPSISRLLPTKDAERDYYQNIKKVFGNDETILIALHANPLFTSDVIDRIEIMTDALERLPGIHHVDSLATAPNLLTDGGDLHISPFSEQFADAPESGDLLKAQALANPLYRGRLLSEDGNVTTIAVHFRGVEESFFTDNQTVESIYQIVETHRGPIQAWITGSQILKFETAQAVVRELRTILPTIIGIIALFLALAFHSIRAVLLPITTIAVAMIWTLGTVAALGLPLNLVTSIVPPLILTLGLAYAMHVLSEFFATEREGFSGTMTERIELVLNKVGNALVITGLTTAAGLLALALNRLPAVQEFAWISALGVLYTVFLSLTFMPLMLRYIGCGTLKTLPGAKLFDAAATAIGGFAVRRRQRILIGGFLILITGLIGIAQIEVGTDYVRGFSDEARVRQDYESINKHLAGASPLMIAVEGHVEDTFVDPEVLNALDSLVIWLRQQPEIGSAVALTDHVKLIHQSFNEGNADYFRIPNEPNLTKQLLVFGGGESIESIVDARFSSTVISLTTALEDSTEIKALISRIEDRLQRLPARLDAKVTGNTVLVTRTVDDISGGQLISISVALGIVYLMLAGLFTSWRTGLLALIPNILPVVIYFGTLGWTGTTLNPTTSLIACIVLGIAVDDTIHFLARFSADARNQANEARAVQSALRAVIRPVTFTSWALCVGFLVLTTSELRNQVQFGALAAFTMAVAWFTDVIFTPALSSKVRIVTLWDVIRLDLGEDPQHSIRLMNGMNWRQARTFALLSNIREIPANERVITEGDEAGDIYVIIEGELEAWLERDGEKVHLSDMKRGATIGEVGYFGQKRTANVSTKSDSRLLVFNYADLEKMRKRFPGIAAALYRNMNLIQAERLANTTRLVN